MLTITDSAKNHLNFKRIEQDREYVQLSLKPSGCAGFEYHWDYTDTVPASSRLVEDIIVINEAAQMAVAGSTIDYVNELIGSSFKIINPQASSSCGCGTSFSL